MNFGYISFSHFLSCGVVSFCGALDVAICFLNVFILLLIFVIPFSLGERKDK